MNGRACVLLRATIDDDDDGLSCCFPDHVPRARRRLVAPASTWAKSFTPSAPRCARNSRRRRRLLLFMSPGCSGTQDVLSTQIIMKTASPTPGGGAQGGERRRPRTTKAPCDAGKLAWLSPHGNVANFGWRLPITKRFVISCCRLPMFLTDVKYTDLLDTEVGRRKD